MSSVQTTGLTLRLGRYMVVDKRPEAEAEPYVDADGRPDSGA
jgi:hypothetical protein